MIIGRRMLMIFGVLFVGCVMILASSKSLADDFTNYGSYDEMNFCWVNEDVFMWNDWTTLKLREGPIGTNEFGYSQLIGTNYSFCYYYWDDYSYGFSDGEDLGTYELSTTDDDGAKLNQFLVEEDFTIFALSRNYTYYMSGLNPENYTDETECTRVIMVAKFYVGTDVIPEGWMSIQYNNEEKTIDELIPWRYPETQVTHYDAKYPALDSYGWYNSSLIPYIESVAFFRWDSIIYLWDVTDLYDWTAGMVTSSDLYCMWTGKQNCTENAEISYLGIYWEWGMKYTPIGSSEINPWLVDYGEIAEVGWETNFVTVLWLTLFFIPTIALGQYIPKIGFCAGAVLMLLIFSTMYLSFLPTAIFGFVVIGVLLYKED